MTTLIYEFDKKGHVIGRCDARCYNAITKECKCVCGGINHGKGLQKARETTKYYADSFKSRLNVKVAQRILQGDLFE